MPQLSSNRRNFLRNAALGAGGLMLGSIIPKRALAQEMLGNRRFLFAYFDGGWDQLLGLDPRDPATTNPGTHKIDPAYGQLGGAYAQRGVQRVGQLRFGPAVPPELIQHAPDFSIVNAIGMDTAAHEVGRRYFITGRFPRGLAAVGSSTAAEIVAQRLGDKTPIPHVSAAVESFADGVPSYATALTVNSITDLIVALTPFAEIDPGVLRAVQAFQDEKPGCATRTLDRDGLATTLLKNQQRARSYIEQQLGSIFDLSRTDAEMTELRTRYGLTGAAAAPNSPETLAFVAAQTLKKGISQAASVRIADGLDTHSNWAADQAPRQERGWRALASLISDLKATPLPEDNSKSIFDVTTMVVFSEFARTPLFNNLRGRDHFLGNSCLVAGPGLKRGITIGRSAEIGMMPLNTELSTGAGIEMPTAEQTSTGRVVALSPKHVLATVLRSVGLDPSYLRSDPIGALLV